MPSLIYLQATHGELGCFITYWYGRDDIVAAINLALKHAETIGDIANPYVSSLASDARQSPPEGFEQTQTPALFENPTRYCWEPNDEDKSIIFPYGVVPGDGDGPFNPDEIIEGYSHGTEDGNSWVDVVVDGRRFLDVVASCYHWLPKPDGLEIRIMHHWCDSDHTEIWLMDDCESYLAFLVEHAADIVDNGFVEFAFYSRSTDTILRVTEHRTLMCTSGDDSVRHTFCHHVESLGFHWLPTFRSLAAERHHFHYNRMDGLGRSELRDLLADAGFRKVDEISA